MSTILISKRPETFMGLSTYATDTGCKIICGIEPNGWHLSISHKYRDPTWEEIKIVRYQLMPSDIQVVMLLPPMAWYVNIHNYCFHLWEMKNPVPE
jgi:hypothetical protein